MNLRSALGFIGLIALLAVLMWWQQKAQPTPPTEASSISNAPEVITPSNDEPLLGEVLLENYADPKGTVQQDLQYIQRLLMSVRTLVKTLDPGRMAVNEDVVDVLLGKNNYKTIFLPQDHPAINDAGQLIDRWDTPLFFHLEAADRLDVRSAGPDKRLFTSDDCHLHADGAFMESDRLGSLRARGG